MAEKKLVLYVLTERGTRAEADEARELFGGEGVDVVIGTAWGHSAGQRISGDVVVIGTAAPTIEDDATGKVKRYASMASARGAHTRAATAAAAEPPPEPAPAPAPAPEPERRPGRVDLPRPPPEPEKEADPLKGRSRVEVIQEAARRWPGARRWATLTDKDLGAAIDELEARD